MGGASASVIDPRVSSAASGWLEGGVVPLSESAVVVAVLSPAQAAASMATALKAMAKRRIGVRLPPVVTYLYLFGVAMEEKRQTYGHHAGEEEPLDGVQEVVALAQVGGYCRRGKASHLGR